MQSPTHDVGGVAVAVAHEQQPGFAGPHGIHVSSGAQTGMSMQSRHDTALQPARMVGQGSQCGAQYVVWPCVGTQDGVSVNGGAVGVGVGEYRGAQAQSHPHCAHTNDSSGGQVRGAQAPGVQVDVGVGVGVRVTHAHTTQCPPQIGVLVGVRVAVRVFVKVGPSYAHPGGG